MLRLRTLGGAVLTRDGLPIQGPASQQRRMALLAAIASAGDRGISRDTLLGLLWPDVSSERARHSLSQWLFLMRRDLGIDDLLLGSASLRLNPQHISADVAEFDAAIAAGDDAAAVALYDGPFLEGFFLSEAPDFEQWLDRERDRRHRDAVRAVERLARTAETIEPARSVVWWQRLVSLDPLSGPAAAKLIRVLAATGDPVAALAQARRHEVALSRELGVGVSPDVASLVAQVRSAVAANTVPSARASGAPADPYLTFVREHLAPHFVVDRLVARTSLASVFDARSTQHHAPFALKVFLPDLMARSDRDALVRALRVSSQLDHPAIDSPLIVDHLEGIVFSAVPGAITTSLRERIEAEPPLSIREALQIATIVASTLAHAHEHGIIHGDLTPKRLSLSAMGVRVADFGVIAAVATSMAGTPNDSAITLGTPAYMSPEMLAGDTSPSNASDVYSLGCILFHMLTGAPPHAGVSARAIITNRLRESAASARLKRADIGPEVDQLLSRMLARSVGERPTSTQVLHALTA